LYADVDGRYADDIILSRKELIAQHEKALAEKLAKK